MNESPFVRVYEDEEHRKTSDEFWVNLNNVDSIEISKGGLIFLDIQQRFLKGSFLVTEEDSDKVRKYLGLEADDGDSN